MKRPRPIALHPQAHRRRFSQAPGAPRAGRPSAGPDARLDEMLQLCRDRGETGRIALLLNPLSYRTRNRDIREVLERHYVSRGILLQEATHREAIRHAVRRLQQQGVRLLIAVGGDGTTQGVITEAWHAYGAAAMPDLAVVPGGRTNVISRDLNGPGNPVRVLRELMHNYCTARSGAVRERRLMQIDIPGEPAQLGFLVTGGGLASGIESCWQVQQTLRPLGPLHALATPIWIAGRISRYFLGRRPLLDRRKVQVSLDGERLAGDRHQIMIATMNRSMPLGIRPFWGDARGTDDRIRVSIVAADARGLWWRMLPFVMGWQRWLPQRAGYSSHTARRVDLLLEKSIHIDGERWPLAEPANLSLRVSMPIRFITTGRARP